VTGVPGVLGHCNTGCNILLSITLPLLTHLTRLVCTRHAPIPSHPLPHSYWGSKSHKICLSSD
jgi:hypothetical protein